jgi:UV DNA damage endonuclease
MKIPENFRLGYACINTELRKQKIFCSRTLRLNTAKTKGVDYIKTLALQNVKDLYTILEYNVKHGIFFMRISSDLFPFATHPEFGYDLDFADSLLKKAGKYAKENGIRLTCHPGQYNVLSSNKEQVVINTVKDLNHHCDFLDRMELDQDSVMIIHGGGCYNNKKDALERLKLNIKLLPENTRNRLVLENCEMSYSIDDLIDISEELQMPIVLDFHHDAIKPSSHPADFYFDRIFKVWNDRGIKPKVHVSNSVVGVLDTDNKTKRRKHSDYIRFFHEPLLKITFDIDVMLEAKQKEQAIFRLTK